MSAESFENRYATMQQGIEYPKRYQPYHLGNGLIFRFEKGANGLNSFSAPDNLTAIYVSNSKTPEGFSYDKMDKHQYYWPMPDEAYAKFITNK
jgi:hypothetical protein